MPVYKDMTFCSDIECQNYKCIRHANKVQPNKVRKVGLPVAWSNFKSTCNEYIDPYKVKEND